MENLKQKILRELGRASINQDDKGFSVTVFKQIRGGTAWVVAGEYEDKDELKALEKAYNNTRR